MEITIDPKLLKPIQPQTKHDWKLWQKKNFNIHRGVIEFKASHVESIVDLAWTVRNGIVAEYRPGWIRGFGFGAIIHFDEVPANFTRICDHVDRRNKRYGVWQWVIACFDEDKKAVAIHTWLHGYLRPVYDSVLQQLQASGYECYATDAEMDALFVTLQRISATCRIIQRIGGIIS